MGKPKMRWAWFAAGLLFLPGLIQLLVFEQRTGTFERWYVTTISVRPEAAAAEADELLRRAAGVPRIQSAIRLTGPAEHGGGGLRASDLSGDYYEIADVVIDLPGGGRRLVAVPRNGNYPVLYANLAPGQELHIVAAE